MSVAQLPAGVGAVTSRMQEIQARFAPAPAVNPGRIQPATYSAASAYPRTGEVGSASFASVLDLARASAVGDGPAPADGGPRIVAAAKRYLGVPYVWGGTDPARGLDCSGLVQRVFADLGVNLPRVSRDQAKVGVPVDGLANARPGDLVAFGNPVRHIGIYVGDGMMLNAPKPGEQVRIERIDEMPTAIRRVEVPGASRVAAASASAPPRAGGSSSFDSLFAAAETRYQLPAGLLKAVAVAESGLRPDAVSPAGAVGLMQIMPATARGLGVDPRDPAQAIDGAARLFARNLRDFGSLDLALAAYNAGPGAVRRSDGIPPYAETRAYVAKVLDLMKGAAA